MHKIIHYVHNMLFTKFNLNDQIVTQNKTLNLLKLSRGFDRFNLETFQKVQEIHI